MAVQDTVTVEVVETVHVPDHGLVFEGETETLPDTDGVRELVTAGALKTKPAKKPAPDQKKEDS